MDSTNKETNFMGPFSLMNELQLRDKDQDKLSITYIFAFGK